MAAGLPSHLEVAAEILWTVGLRPICVCGQRSSSCDIPSGQVLEGSSVSKPAGWKNIGLVAFDLLPLARDYRPFVLGVGSIFRFGDR